MQIAANKEFNTLAFPCISTGIYKYPKILAAEIAVKICEEQLQKNGRPQRVIFVVTIKKTMKFIQKFYLKG
ncbi:hypothetical protein F8S20_16100 [Nostoc sp. BAE]|nr:hypothetical protein [Nostoc commune BAE]